MTRREQDAVRTREWIKAHPDFEGPQRLLAERVGITHSRLRNALDLSRSEAHIEEHHWFIANVVHGAPSNQWFVVDVDYVERDEDRQVQLGRVREQRDALVRILAQATLRHEVARTRGHKRYWRFRCAALRSSVEYLNAELDDVEVA